MKAGQPTYSAFDPRVRDFPGYWFACADGAFKYHILANMDLTALRGETFCRKTPPMHARRDPAIGRKVCFACARRALAAQDGGK